ncbi:MULTISPECIES: ATP-binding protein [Streptomyces]|uniref:ATP-binding protein n=1 Tax=Streptomyces TaxID=1883 RepID=UPI001316C060|nr:MULTISPECIES: ATP-binding protein [Streptomyces]QGZ49260.1 ATP-binding protein [Streptomyces sp. QHH-9511]GGU10057.1 ATPase [Streptomyces lateritius]
MDTAAGGREAEGSVHPAADAAADVPAVADAPAAADVSAAAGVDVRTLALGAASGTVPLARDFTRSLLYDWGWLPAASADARAAAEDVLLVVSELVTNACLHADGPELLRVVRRAKVLRLEVADRGAGQPAPRTPHRSGRPGGHGMFIVQRLCLDWGIERSPGEPGKTVWAELAAPA